MGQLACIQAGRSDLGVLRRISQFFAGRSQRRRAVLIPTVAAVQTLEDRAMLAAKVIVAPSTYEFRDMGFDPATQEVGIVGYEGTGTIGVTKIAKLFELNEAGNGFTAQTLVGLGNPVYVTRISNDGSRLGGASKSLSSVSVGEGTTWLRNSPSTPHGIGYLPPHLSARTSVVGGVWRDGVVGDSGGGA